MTLFIGVALSILLTYPLQVALCRVDVSVGRIAVPLVLIGAVVSVLLKGGQTRVSVSGMWLLAALWALVAWYAVSAGLNGVGRRSGLWTISMLVQYAVWLSVLLLLSNQLRIVLPNPTLEFAVAGVSLANVAAVLAQSLMHRAPEYMVATADQGVLMVGMFMRAGRIYTDPNALGLLLVLAIFLNIMLVRRYQFLRIACIVALSAAVLMTFSRAAIVFAGGMGVVWLLAWGVRRIGSAAVLLVLVATGALSWAGFAVGGKVPGLRAVIASVATRFISEEGVSSALSRSRQYRRVTESMSDSWHAWVFGLGPGVADDLFDENVHNFFLATFADAGLPAVGLLCFLVCGFWMRSRTVWARMYLTYAVLQLMTLPNFYSSMLLACGMCLVSVDDQSGSEGTGASRRRDTSGSCVRTME